MTFIFGALLTLIILTLTTVYTVDSSFETSPCFLQISAAAYLVPASTRTKPVTSVTAPGTTAATNKVTANDASVKSAKISTQSQASAGKKPRVAPK